MISQWEKEQLYKEQKIRERKLRRELKQLNEPSKYSNVGASKVQMGSPRATEIEDMLSNSNIEMLEKADTITRFEELRERIHRLGNEGWYDRKNDTFRQNFMGVLERYESFDNYDKLIEKLNSIKDNEKFYRYIENSELAMDFLYNSDETFRQAQFNNMIKDLIGDTELIDSE